MLLSSLTVRFGVENHTCFIILQEGIPEVIWGVVTCYDKLLNRQHHGKRSFQRFVLFFICNDVRLRGDGGGCAYEHNVLRGQRRMSNALELESQEVMSCSMWVLGNKLRSSGKAANGPNH